MKKIKKSILILVTLLLFLLLSLINAPSIIHSILEYSKLFLTKLFPVSFLFFIISNLLINYGLVEIIESFFHINMSQFYVLLISGISGFPSGAKCIKDLVEKNIITLEEANKMIKFSHFPNPLFIFGTISTILKDNTLTQKLYLAIILSNILIFITQKYKNSNTSIDIPYPENFSLVLTKAINSSFQTILLIYGTSLFFFLISTLIIMYIPISSYGYVLINGLFDLTKGVFATTIIQNKIIQAYFILFFIQFGGISIHMQTKGILSNSQISYLSFVTGRIISTIISFILLYLFLKF